MVIVVSASDTIQFSGPFEHATTPRSTHFISPLSIIAATLRVRGPAHCGRRVVCHQARIRFYRFHLP